MQAIRRAWNRMFDIREGEYLRLFFMALYLVTVLFAYYILKPVSRAMFLAKFDIDNLPGLYILIAGVGGFLAYLFTKAAIKTSLKAAVTASFAVAVTCLVAIWWLLGFGFPWMLYVFSVFVSIFSITLVSQGWLVAANVFTTREAKRLYGLLGVGAVAGAAFGGTFTSWTVYYIGSRNLLLASAAMTALAYLAFLGVVRQSGQALVRARGAAEEEGFQFKDILLSIGRYRHLQVIISIIALTYIVDVMIEYQFNAIAKETFADVRRLTAFLASFYGIWLNLVTFVLQFFLTAFVVSHFGVGGTLQIMPLTIGLASLVTFVTPNVASTGSARITESATRYSFNRTGMELLYLPLPTDLKNRTKAFVDIFFDRLSRGVGGVVLLVLTVYMNLEVRHLSLVVIGFTLVWIVLSIRAKNEYVSTVRRRLETRRLDLESLRINVRDRDTVRLLEQAIASGAPRQITYGLSLLAQAPGYPLEKALASLADHSSPEVRAAVFGLARERNFDGLLDRALAELRSSRPGADPAAIRPAVEYALAVSPEAPALAARLLDHPHHLVAQSALEALAQYPETLRQIITPDWIGEAAASPDAGRRTVAAAAIRVHGDKDTGALHKLLLDRDPGVAEAACRTAAALEYRTYIEGLLRRLEDADVRRCAIEALAQYGERIVGTLADVLLDDTMPLAVRRQIPRVLQRIQTQRSAEVLLASLDVQDLTVRTAVLKALNKLRDSHPQLNYGRDSVLRQFHKEARYYYELHAALASLRTNGNGTAARLLVRTLQARLEAALERLFRLLGLRYPPKEIYAAYLAVHRRRSEEFTAALEFLDTILERELKRVLLPLLDEDSRVVQVGRELFGVDSKDVPAALRDLMRSGDSWLAACSVATAAELRLRDLSAEISELSRGSGQEVGEVARAAIAVLS
ncbi:MAG: HEAT repeat domain-containing protein [Acidobacteria bacterium]|nr:HEAT repeat domain-containing protein [Acidobacteriota bacterium]